MNPTDHHAETVWERTLPHIRSTRRRRGFRRIAAATAACCGLAIWINLQGTKAIDKPVAHIEPAAPVFETIAVMKIDDNGDIRLEEIASNELGAIELTLGQVPLISSDLQF